MKKMIFTLITVAGFFSPVSFLFSQDNISGKGAAAYHAAYPAYSILEAVYDCRVEGQIVYGEVKYKIKIWGEETVAVPVLSEEVAINKTNLSKEVLLIAKDGVYQLIFSKKGEYSVSLEFCSKINKQENKNIFTFKPSNSVISRLNLVIPGKLSDIEVTPSNIQTKITTRGSNTELTAFLGTAGDFQVNWSSETQAATAPRPVFLSENNMITFISDGIIKTTALLNYKVMQGRISRLEIELPANANLLAVKGDNIKSWDLKQGENKQVLEVELSQEVKDSCELRLEIEESKSDTGQVYKLAQITTIGADRQSGHIAVVPPDDLKIQPLEKTGLSQIDPAQLPEKLTEIVHDRISLAYQYSQQPVVLSLNIEKVKPEISVRSNIFLDVSEDLMKLYAYVDYDIRKVGVFEFHLELPGDFTLIDVEGEGIEDWTLTKEGTYQELGARLKNKVLGQYRFLVKMEKPVSDVFSGKINMPQVKVKNVKNELGYIGISSASSIKLIAGQRENIAEIDISELGNTPAGITIQPMLAYKYIQQPYQLQLAVQAVDPRVTSEVFTFMSVEEGLLLVDSAINYNIMYAGIDEFKIAFPQDIQVVDITGTGIKSKEEIVQEREINGKKVKQKVWVVRLHSKVSGQYNLYCSYEKIMKNADGIVELPKLEVIGVHRETGYWALGSRTNSEIKTDLAIGATPIDISELPADKAKGIDVPLLLAFKYVKHPYAITIDVKRYEDVSVLVAMAESADITTMLTTEGQIIVDSRYMIKNRQKQYLDIILPKDANIWGAFVNNKPVKPGKTAEDHIMIPLEKSIEENKLCPVEIIYEAKCSSFKLAGRLKMIQPQLDIPLSNVTCKLYLPEEFGYAGFGGNLKLVKARKAHYGRQYSAVTINEQSDIQAEQPAQMVQGNKKEDKEFLDNVFSQAARYQSYVNKTKSSEPQGKSVEVKQGKSVGALPIRVSVPVAGKLYTFSKVFSSSEQLTVSAVYAKGLSAKSLVWMIIIGLFLVGFLKRKQWTMFRKKEQVS